MAKAISNIENFDKFREMGGHLAMSMTIIQELLDNPEDPLTQSVARDHIARVAAWLDMEVPD